MTREESNAGVGHMPPTEEIPEVPTHRLVVTGDGENATRYVDSGYFSYGSLHLKRDHLIVRCGVCGQDSKDWGFMRHHAWMDHEMHFSMAHVGKKIVWRREDLPSAKAAVHSYPSARESRYGEEDNEWDRYLFKARGDCPDENAAETARRHLDAGEQAELVIEHRPPQQPYPGSIEEGAELEVRPSPDNPPEAIA